MPLPKVLPHIQEYGTPVIVGEPALILKPQHPLNSATRLIVCYHGATGDQNSVGPLAFGEGSSYRYLAHIAAHNFLIVSSSMMVAGEVDGWGIEAYDVRTDDIIAWAAALGVDTTKIGMYGGSGGTFPMSNYWRRHRQKVGAAIYIVPATHLENVYTDNPTLQARINAIHGSATAGMPYSPINWGEELAGPEPVGVLWADDDIAVRDADIEDWVDQIEAEWILNTTTGGHGNIGQYDTDVADWVRIYEALR